MRGVLITLFPVAVALLACGYGSDDETRTETGIAGAGGTGFGGSSGAGAEEASIDTGAALTTDPGQGIGALIAYEAGGKWNIAVACDTALSSETCFWDILVEPVDGSGIRKVTPDSVESDDDFAWDSTGARLVTTTTNDIDGIFIEADPGAALKIDVLLDGDAGNAFVYWIGGGAMHRGAPTNPIILTPSEP